MKAKILSKNIDCIVRDRPCGRVFSGSNICFVASPAAEEVGLELDVIKSVLTEEDIEPFIAIEHIAPAKDIFCSKICTKIIESKVCVAILTGLTKQKGLVLPNPNVYYEYGLMTAWSKPLIPIQRKDQKLSFNIQSLDTVKYSPKNFREQFHAALRIVLSTMEEKTEDEYARPQLQEILGYYMEIKGSAPYPSNKGFTKRIPFYPFHGFKFGAVIARSDTIERISFSTKILYRRLEAYVSRLERELENIKKASENLKENKPALEKLTYKYNQKKSLIDIVRGVEIIIVDSSGRELGKEILPELQKIKSNLNPSITLLYPDDIKAGIDLA
ncbi:MAG: hypothetical protein ACETWC_10815 [Acidobacteriota bacterium]